MKSIPLNDIGLSIKCHTSALWWLGLLYRRPQKFIFYLGTLPAKRAREKGLILFLHLVPYLFLICLIFKFLIISFLNNHISNPHYKNFLEINNDFFIDILFGILFWLIIEFIFVISISINGEKVFIVAYGFFLNIITLIAFTLVFRVSLDEIFLIQLINASIISIFVAFSMTYAIFSIPLIILSGVIFSLLDELKLHNLYAILIPFFFLTAVIVTQMIAKRSSYRVYLHGTEENSKAIAGVVALIFTSTIGIGTALGFAVNPKTGIIFSIAFNLFSFFFLFRIYYQFIHILFLLISIIPITSVYRYHPVAWDDLCILRFPGLHKILLKFVNSDRILGMAEIERLIRFYPSQRISALLAKTILIAHDSARISNLQDLYKLMIKLPEGDMGFLCKTLSIKNRVKEICLSQDRLDLTNRPILREILASDIYTKIDNFKHTISGLKEPLFSVFMKAAENWEKIAEIQLNKAREKNVHELTPQIFRASDLVDRDQEAFVPRYGILGELDKQLTLATGCPGLVLYGRRRMGKSTILHNLPGFIPDTVKPIFISMERPAASSSLLHFIRHIIGESSKFLPDKQKVESPVTDLVSFFDTLSHINEDLKARDQRLILALDEYEYIDHNIGSGVFPENLLATLRESIQSHRQIIWLFAGSHEITELRHAPWTSFLVSVRTLEVPAFSFEETRLLLTEPMKNSSLWAKDAPNRPRFQPEFWGENGIERIHQQTAGWPHLVQLVAETIVDLINDTNKKTVDDELFEQALDKAIVSGHNVFSELLLGESRLPGEWDYLSAFRRCKFQPPPEEEQIYRSLRRRLLVAEENDQWYLRVPLMERWLKRRG